MRQPKLIDYTLLVILALIWASAFFNIKIATESFGPITIAFLRVFFGSIPVLLLCFYKKIKIEGNYFKKLKQIKKTPSESFCFENPLTLLDDPKCTNAAKD